MNLLVDGHAFLNVISPVALYLLKQNSSYNEIFDNEDNLTDEAKDFFKNFSLKFLSNIMFPYKSMINKVYFVLDNDSWRKYYANKFCNRNPNIEPFEYKGNRKKGKDTKKNVYKFFKHFFKAVAPDLATIDGITVLSVRGAEGDDLIFHLTQQLKDHNIIWSGDMDLAQLLKWEDNVTFMVTPKRQHKNVKMVYLPLHENTGIDLSNNTLQISNVFNYFKDQREYSVEESDFNIELMVKLIHGDPGDNVQSMYHYLSDSGRRMNVSEAQARSIITGLISKYNSKDFIKLIDERNEEFLTDIVNATFIKKNLTKKNDERKLKAELLNNLLFNIKMIRLAYNNVPEILIDTIKQKFEIVKNTKDFNYHEFMSYVKMEQGML